MIPLVDSEFKILPLHFAVDPGVNFNWETCDDSTVCKIELSHEQKLDLLKKYVIVEHLPIHSSCMMINAALNREFLDAGYCGSEGRVRSDSNSGSYESDEGTNSTSSSENGGKTCLEVEQIIVWFKTEWAQLEQLTT